MKMKYVWWIVALLIVIGGLWWWMGSGSDYEFKNSPRPLLGNPNATVHVIEFSDIQCSACKAANPVVKRIVQEYGDRISFEYKHFPLTIHTYSRQAAEAAECANDQRKFWEFLDYAFAHQNEISSVNMPKFAGALGLDVNLFKSCVKSNVNEGIVDADNREAIQLQLRGTPTFIINSKQLSDWRYDNFKAAVEAELKK